MNSSPLLLASLSLASWICSGCIPKKPDMPDAISQFPSHWSSKTNNEEANATPWVPAMGSVQLEKLVTEAWKNNQNLAAASQRMEIAREEAVIAGADSYPQAGLGVNGSRTKRNLIGFNFPNSSSSFTSESYGLNLNLSWELDLWRKLKDTQTASEAEWAASAEDYEAAKLSLAGQVAKSWYSSIEAKQQRLLAEAMAQTHSRNSSYISKRFDRGLASALDHNLAKAALASSKAVVARWKRQGDLSIRTLETLLGRYPDGNATLPENLPQTISPVPVSTPAQTLEKRPDLRAARLRLVAVGLQVAIARKRLLPSLSLSGSPGSRSDQFEDLLDNQFRIWNIAGNLTQTLFQGGRLKANARRAEAARKGAIQEYKDTALQAFREAEVALAADSLFLEEEAELNRAAESSKLAADLSWDRYQRGLEGILTTLEASRRAFEAESRLLSLRRERLLNRVDLHLALGDEALAKERKNKEEPK
ncbi:MAG: hypothetical protein CMI31_01535 [Opitutae bacterium]|nr:hypothetical protein [Opitutae bacterium]